MVSYELICKKQTVTAVMLERWFRLACDYFLPVDMRRGIKTRRKFNKYNEKRFWTDLGEELYDERMCIDLHGEGIKFNSIHVCTSGDNPDYISLSYSLSYQVVDEKFVSCFEEFVKENAIVAFCSDLEDYVFQNERDTWRYEEKGVALKNLHMIGKWVDIEYNPGHSHRVNGMWFGSCYRMWFGKEYYNYIRKAKFQIFKDCYENVELDNEVIRITLYQNIHDYDKKENRDRLWSFRKTVGMDDAAIRLKRIQDEKVSDPEVEIQTGIFEHGGVRVTRQYFDHEGNRIAKSKAIKVHMEEYDKDGKCIFSQDVEIN